MAEKKILIVDYDSKSLDSLAQLFEPYDFHIIKATDGVSGYENFASQKPDLVILEAMLPKLHGFDLAKKISHETKGKVPVIIVTGLYRGPQYRNEALNFLGASDYFEKPFDKSKLVESALNLLDEGEEIGEDLPSDETILEGLSKRIKRSSKKSQGEEESEKENSGGDVE
jgi:DNA-binding response OmpR family regulator